MVRSQRTGLIPHTHWVELVERSDRQQRLIVMLYVWLDTVLRGLPCDLLGARASRRRQPIGTHRLQRNRRLIAQLAAKVRAARTEAAAGATFLVRLHLPRDRDQLLHSARQIGTRDATQQTRRVGMPRLREDPVHFAGLDDFAGVHHGGAITDPRDQAEIVRNEQHRRPACSPQLAKQIDNASLDRHVERRRRLVQQQQTRLWQQRHRDDRTLLLPTGELMWIRRHDAFRVRYLHLREHVLCSDARLVTRQPAMNDGRLDELRADTQTWVQDRHSLLVNHTDAGAA